MKYSIDANVVRCIAHDDRGAVDVLVQLAKVGRQACGISAIVAFDLHRSAGNHRITRVTRAKIAAYLAQFVIIPFDAADAAEAALVEREIKGNTPGVNDVLIAAQARRRGLVVVTDNEKDFRRVPGLKLENWLRAR